MTSLTKKVIKEAIFQGFIRKEKLVIHIKPRNGKAKNNLTKIVDTFAIPF